MKNLRLQLVGQHGRTSGRMPRTISLSAISELISILPNIDGWESQRALDARLHGLITGQNAIRVSVTIAEIVANRLPSDASDLYHEVEQANPVTEDDWARVDEIFETDCFNDEGKLVAARGPRGYEDKAGKFIAKPQFTLIPEYCQNAESAMTFKSWFTRDLMVRITEVDGPLYGEYVAELLDTVGNTVAKFQAFPLALSIVGASLVASQRGWLNAAFNATD